MIAPVSEESGKAVAAPAKVWQVGTLTYTTGGLVVLFCWLLWGDFAWSMRERSVTWVMQLLLKKFQASDLLTSLLIMTLPAALGMVISPIVSYRSDRHRGRWGRRIPFLIWPTPFIVLSMVALAFGAELGGLLHRLLGAWSPGESNSILIVLGVFWVIFEAAVIVAAAVFGGLINDVVPTRFLGRFYGMFRALSLIAGMIFNYWLLARAESHTAWVFLGIAGLYAVGFTVMCLKVKEGKYPPPPPPPQAHPGGVAGGFFPAMRSYLRTCFTNRYYLLVFTVLTLSAVTFAPVFTFSVFFAKSVQMDMGTYGKCTALMLFISLCLAYPLGALADRFHPIRMGIAALVLHVGVTLWAGLCAKDAHTFAIALVSEGVLAGVWSTCTASLSQRLYPRARFAELASAQGILGAVASMGLAPMVGLFLDYTGHVYRYTYLISCGLTVLALVGLVALHARFMALGGVKNYQAPE